MTSGIKSASKMVEEWIETLYREATNHTGALPADWATDKTLGITGFDPKDQAGSYSAASIGGCSNTTQMSATPTSKNK